MKFWNFQKFYIPIYCAVRNDLRGCLLMKIFNITYRYSTARGFLKGLVSL